MDVQTFARAITHPLRRRILERLPDKGGSSPKDLSEEFGASIAVVSYHFRELQKAKLIKLVKRVPRRGAVEHYYVRASGVGSAVKALDKLAQSLDKIGKR